MNSLYTPEVAQYVRSRNWPKGLQLDVKEEYIDVEGIRVPQLKFVFYRDNWLTFAPHEHLTIALTVKELMEKLRADGIPCYMDRMESRSIEE